MVHGYSEQLSINHLRAGAARVVPASAEIFVGPDQCRNQSFLHVRPALDGTNDRLGKTN